MSRRAASGTLQVHNIVFFDLRRLLSVIDSSGDPAGLSTVVIKEVRGKWKLDRDVTFAPNRMYVRFENT